MLDITVVLIETLGVTKEAKKEDIEQAYSRLKEYFDPSKNSDPNVRIFFDDLTL
jgi:DnaJ-class molecular chaperone